MAADTKIEWCDHTFNPWTGCTKVSPGCDHCYAEGWSKRAGAKAGQWGPGAPRVRTTAANWRQPVKWNAQADAFAAQHGRRQRVFCASLGDVFDNEVPAEWRADLFDLIQATPNLDWLLLTKRIGNAWKMMADACGVSMASARLPLTNVWLGATIVDQPEADRDIFKLLNIPAKVHFLSMEPLLGPIDLRVIDIDGDREIHPLKGTTHCVNSEGEPAEDLPRIDWVIVGGESGIGARPIHPDWVRSLRNQCTAAGVPFHFKQWGEWHTRAFSISDGQPVFREFASFQHWVNKASTWVQGGICLDRHGTELRNGGDMARARDAGNFPVTIMHKVGKKAAGRLLDGRTWDGAPTP